MAPESAVLKRVRSKPAEWWAAATLAPPPASQERAPSKKRTKKVPNFEKSEDERAGTEELDVRRKGRGKRRRANEDDEEEEKGVREMSSRGGWSSGEDELRSHGREDGVGEKATKTKSGGQKAIEDDKISRGRKLVFTKEQVQDASADGVRPRKKKYSKPAGGSPKESNSVRRGRSSNTEAELRAVNYKETATRKPNTSQPTMSSSSMAGKSAATTTDSLSTSKNNALDKKSAAPKATRSVEEYLSIRRRRSSNTKAELQAINYKETASRKSNQVDPTFDAPPLARIFKKSQKSSSRQEEERRRGRSSNTEAELRTINYKEAKTINRKTSPRSGIGSPQNNSGQVRGSLRSASGVEKGSSQVMGDGRKETQGQLKTGTVQATSRLSKERATANQTSKGAVGAKRISSSSTSSAKRSEKSKKGAGAGTVSGAQGLAPPKRMKSKPSQSNEIHKRRAELDDAQADAPPSKCRRSENIPEEELEPPAYQHLAAVTRRVSRATIDAKWDGLPAPCVERISQLFQDVQKPVLARFRDERQQSQASTALQWVSRKLVGKVSRGLPFPLSTRRNGEDDFDFEKILDNNRALELQLTPALHANELLEAELAKEMALLEGERGYLDELESNAKAETSKRKQDARKLHSLLQPAGQAATSDREDHIALRMIEPMEGETFDLCRDETLQDVVQDLQGHVDSIEGNLKQVEGIAWAVAQSKAAVQATLVGRLDSAQYEEVVLG